eukprot:CAMPEP_0198283654 /NCGR_PEP_ID=MMETSP1449-20131203/3224_1 /TAXON_ID=420275 /ORGANISM="Attheya septentrionalis, Strain CCMP2084" /LENGTH=272 /DNA_ID=CAMNT_0043980363 /DNA_START=160 /DNA_END=981 /DNA_ORIENTATION=+
MTISYSDVCNDIMSNFNLDFLKDRYARSGMKTSFANAKKDYIQYLVALVSADALGVETSPPLHVDALWHIHILETKSYRAFERLVIEKYKPTHSTSLEHIDHSVVDNTEGREDRLKKTKALYKLMDLIFENEDDEKYNEESQRAHSLPALPEASEREENVQEVTAFQSRDKRSFETEEENARKHKERRTEDVPKPKISLRLTYENGQESFFLIRQNTTFGRLFNICAMEIGIEVTSLRFTNLGERIDPDHTPAMLKMEDNAQIFVYLQMTGC